MPNRDAHILIGAIAGALGYIGVRILQGEEVKPLSVLLSAGLGAVAGELPDIIEPATNPNHRATAHSVTVGSGVAFGVVNLESTLGPIDKDTKAIIAGAACGYLSHLLTDGATPKSLPLI